LDINKDGQLQISELRQAFEAGGVSVRSDMFWQQVIDVMDKNKDNQVSLEEFIEYMDNIANDEEISGSLVMD
jgi:Ca2+-binding EF-hand superfamily protein